MGNEHLLSVFTALLISIILGYYYSTDDNFLNARPEARSFILAVGVPILTHSLVVAAYRSIWHPLAKYPGPWWATLTDWYSVYHIIKGDRHIDFYRLHERYGKIVRFGPDRISIRSAAALKDIYSVSSNVKRSKVYASTAHFFGGTPSSNTTPDMKEHAFRRRVNVRALNPTNIKAMEEQILKNIRYFCDHLMDANKEEWSSPRNMSELVGYLVSDIMGDITFSKSWEVQQKPDNRDILTSLPQAVAGIHLVGYMPGIVTFKLDKIFFRTLVAGINRFTGLSASIFQWRFAQKGCNDFFSALLQAKDEKTGKGFSTNQLVSEAGLLTIAGSDTTVTATTGVFFYLVNYSTSLSRLEKEIRSSFSGVEEIRIGPQLASCHYLLACIEESLRMSPPVGSTLMREVLPGGLTVDGDWFPPGTDLAVPHYALHHDESYFPKSFLFKPERWLSGSPRDRKSSTIDSTAASAFTAFGTGRTSCIGKYLAYQEISLVVARTVWLFDMRLQPGSTLGQGSKSMGPGRERKKEFQTWDKFVSIHNGPMVQFKRREL
ncbi:benzoate 4-monooxygenase cytochrome-like protein P450 [Lindgomyces ingoldianus]|uniref:Benzoate 4-monooxygenase cytochrome-like protein P450 n=1 Tax=Lindgomyces ingoldianus TaxID=673940 RepID=A0ACB6QWG9_9PLEO|nr:benzoate 4-monooxygenase cytochrome-like protein P450 [Lindgomyces ingoldianus]KAF2470541.1 benzoate 4-monooxygenase cytochrome-like protein P450 [Lindgomyces ingoldianus]